MLIMLKALNNFTVSMRERREEVAERVLQEGMACPRRWRESGTYSQGCPGTLFPSAPLEKASF